MLLKKTNIQERLLSHRNKTRNGEAILAQVKAFLEVDEEDKILKSLHKLTPSAENKFDFDLLETDRIFHLNDIEKICVNYRLRFLDSKYFKGKIPEKAIATIKNLEFQHDIDLQGFKVMAPSKLFVLKKVDDPLLFAPMGNDYFYLIHKWGNDLHPLRKWMMWPFKSFENLIFAILVSSILATWLVPNGLFSKKQTLSQDLMVFLFMFKSIAAIVLFYAFALGKNFNTAIWQSQYDKTQ